MASALELAKLSSHVYSDQGGSVTPHTDSGGDWVCVRRFGPAGTDVPFDATVGPGFAAAVYQRALDNELAFAIRGTNDVKDLLIDDAMIAGQLNAEQMHVARAAFARARAAYPSARMYLTGHSLGGGIAMLLAAENPDLAAVTFNAPTMNGLAMRPSDLLAPGFHTLARSLAAVPSLRLAMPSPPLAFAFDVLASEPVVVWKRRDDARLLHVRLSGDLVSMGFPPDFRGNPGYRMSLPVPPAACTPFVQLDPLNLREGPLCRHFMVNLIEAIRAAPPSPWLHDDLRWLDPAW